MKKHLVIIAFCPLGLVAQSGSVASGNDLNGSGGSVSFSLGQVAYSYQEGASGSVNQGLQQPYELFVVGLDDFPEILLGVSIAPNPVVDELTLSVGIWIEGLSYTLYDDLGRILISAPISSSATLIEMKNYPPASYFIRIHQQQTQIKSFKIIKH